MTPMPLSSSVSNPTGGTIRRSLLAATLLLLTMTAAGASTARADLPAGSFAFSGAVKSIASTSNGTYVAGQFGGQKAPTGNGLIVGASGSGAPDPTAFDHVAGPVTAVVSDGAGGWYIGGEFTAVGTTAISNLAHIKADGRLDAGWVPDPDGAVGTLERVGTTLYAGGAFTRIGGKSRQGVAAISTATASATAFDPALVKDATPGWDLDVNVVASVSPTEVVIGGAFASAGGQSHKNIVKVDAATGAPKAWDPHLDQYDTVATVAVSGSTLYLGGFFDKVGGQTRHGLAAVDLSSGAVLGWNPSSQQYAFVRDIEAVGGSVYVGGDFTSIGGASRNGVAEVSAATGAATAWNPNIPVSSTFVTEVEVTASAVYVGGYFGELGGQQRSNVGAIDRVTGQVLPWDPQLATSNSDSRIIGLSALAIEGSDVYLGGYFASAGPNIANISGIARLNADGSLDTDWDTEIAGAVSQIVATSTSLYVIGSFTGFGHDAGFVQRRHLAALNPADGSVRTAFSADLTGYLFETGSLTLSGSTLYIGGCLQSINGQARSGIGAVDATTGNVTSWNPGAQPAGTCVNRVAAIGSTVYVSGFFTAIGGQNRAGIAGLDATTANATGWAPPASFNAIASSPIGLILGGNGNVGVSPLSAVNPTTGAQVPWTTSLSGIPEGTWVSAVAVSPTAIYAGGPFWKAGGLSRPRIASFSPTTGAPTAWNPGADEEVVALALDGSDIHLGGAFNAVDGKVTGPYAKIRNSGAPEDRRGPYIAVANVADGQTVAQGATVSPGLTCDDGDGSGVASCISPDAIDTATTGPHTFTATATDNAGNPSTRKIAYVVSVGGPSPDPGGGSGGGAGSGGTDPGSGGGGGAGGAGGGLSGTGAAGGGGNAGPGGGGTTGVSAQPVVTISAKIGLSQLTGGVPVKLSRLKPGSVVTVRLQLGKKTLKSFSGRANGAGNALIKLKLSKKQAAKLKRKKLTIAVRAVTTEGATVTITKTVSVK